MKSKNLKEGPKKFSALKKGEVFNFPNRTKEYKYNGRSSRKFTYSATDDISSHYDTKTDRVIISQGFTY